MCYDVLEKKISLIVVDSIICIKVLISGNIIDKVLTNIENSGIIKACNYASQGFTLLYFFVSHRSYLALAPHNAKFRLSI